MDILNKNCNMKVVAKFIEVNLSGQKQERIVVLSKSNTCICCGVRNVSFIKLNKCSHKEFLECYFKNRVNVTMTVVCHYCHGILKKIDDFIKQVEKCLTDRQVIFYPRPKLTKLRKPIFVEIEPKNRRKNKEDIPPTTFIEISYKRPEIVGKREQLETYTEENNMDTDFEMDIGATMIEAPVMDESSTEIEIPPEVGVSKCDSSVQNSQPVLKPLKAVQNPTTTLKNPNDSNKEMVKEMPIDGCLYGKVEIVYQTDDEMKKEREMQRKGDSYTSLPVKCKDCIIGFLHEDGLTRHMKKHDLSQGDYVCKVCKSVFSTEVRLQAHELRHFKRYQCMVCGKRFKKSLICIAHFNKEHGADGQAIGQIFECIYEDCNFTCSDFMEYKMHKRVHGQKWDCKVCGKGFANSYNLKKHVQTIHNKKRMVYKCKDCGKEYVTKSGVNIHWRSHHDRSGFIAPLQCVVCKRGFKNQTMFEKHCRRHENKEEKWFICDICGEKFRIKDAIRNHMDSVHLKTEYKCKECNKVFLNYRKLRIHERKKHEIGQKLKSLCDLCGKEFKTKQILQQHMIVHTGVKPYKCNFCSATFGYASGRYKHEKVVHKKHELLNNKKDSREEECSLLDPWLGSLIEN